MLVTLLSVHPNLRVLTRAQCVLQSGVTLLWPDWAQTQTDIRSQKPREGIRGWWDTGNIVLIMLMEAGSGERQEGTATNSESKTDVFVWSQLCGCRSSSVSSPPGHVLRRKVGMWTWHISPVKTQMVFLRIWQLALDSGRCGPSVRSFKSAIVCLIKTRNDLWLKLSRFFTTYFPQQQVEEPYRAITCGDVLLTASRHSGLLVLRCDVIITH